MMNRPHCPISPLLYIFLSADVRTMDAFHQKCLRQLLGIRWYDRVRNDEVLQRTGLTSLSHLLSRRRISVFGHVARLDDDTPANMALQLHINVSLNRPPDRTWRHPPRRPRNKWLDQLRNDSTRQYVLTFIYYTPVLCFIFVHNCGLTVRNKRICYVMTGDLWRRAVDRGRGGATTRRPSPATRP